MMKPWTSIFLVLGLLAATASAQPTRVNLPLDGYAAAVNDRIITIGDVDAITRDEQERLRVQFSGQELLTQQIEIFTAGLARLIEDALIQEEFIAMKGLMPDRVIQDEINQIIKERFDNNRAEFLQTLTVQETTLPDFEEQIRSQIIVGEMRRSEVMSKVSVSPRDVREVYESEFDRYRIPARVQLRLIFLSGENTSPEDLRTQAEQARERLLGGEVEFADLAQEISDDSSAAKGGDWGWIDPAILFEDLRVLAETLPLGTTSDLLETPDGIFLVRVEDRTEESAKSFDEVRTEIEAELRQKDITRRYTDWIDRLKRKYYVHVFDGIPDPFARP